MSNLARVSLPLVVALLVGLLGPVLPAAAADMSTISGTVVGPGGVVVTGYQQVKVTAYNAVGAAVASAYPSTVTGAYVTNSFPTQPVTLHFAYTGTSNILSVWSGDAYSRETAAPIALAPGATTAINVTLAVGGVVTGTFQEGVDQYDSIRVGIRSQTPGLEVPPYPAYVLPDRTYRLERVPPGQYIINFSDLNHKYYGEYWEDSVDEETATVVAVGLSETVVLDPVLSRSTSIEGTLTVEGETGPLPHLLVMAIQDGEMQRMNGVEPDGSWDLSNIYPGDYQVCVAPDYERDWTRTCWHETVQGSGGTVTVAQDEVVTGIDFTMIKGGTIMGDIDYKAYPEDTTHPNADSDAYFYRLNEMTGQYEFAERVYGWEFRSGAHSLRPGTYAVRMVDRLGRFSSEYWDDARYWGEHQDIVLEAGETFDMGQTVLEPPYFDVDRISGPSRFATAVEISQAMFEDGDEVPVVYIANGLTYPDALSAGPAAIEQGGGLLLVAPDDLPGVVADELERLSPERIVIVGGAASVSVGVQAELEAFVDSPGDVDRIGGSNRYETSRMLVEDAFPNGASNVFIATGVNFPDALAAGPAAGYLGGPVLLVPGAASALDATTLGLIDDLGVDHAYIAGGLPSVSLGIEASLAAALGGSNAVDRYAGANRFETSVLINFGTFPEAEVAFLATGLGFADALAGVPFAGMIGAPIYLSQPDCVPLDVLYDIMDVDARLIALLGGEPSLSSNVFNLYACEALASEPVTRVGP